MDGSFAPFAEDFLAITAEVVWCTATTVDAAGRPRSRILHPIFEVAEGRPVGWVAGRCSRFSGRASRMFVPHSWSLRVIMVAAEQPHGR